MKKIVGIAAVLTMALLAANVLALDVTAGVTVLGSCGLSATSGSPIVFGSVATGIDSSNQTVAIKNTGSKATTGFTVLGAAWTGGTGMPVGQTSIADTTAWHTLSTSPLTIFSGVISNGETKNPIFKVAIPEGQAQDSYSQTITFTAAC